ncbi:MAG: DNA primase [Acidimicrobiales bacterium]
MAISDADIAQVRASTDIVALISEYAALKKSGRRWTGLCPFHAEKTPSFSVNAEEGFYYCFGCRASGDAITFLREVQHLDFVDAVRQLAERSGVVLHEDAAAGPAHKERQALLETMKRAVAWYHARLLESPDARPAREYLRSRGISGDLARRFQLGWAPDEWDALSSGLDLSENLLTGTGLGFVNRRGRRQDALRARIIFPILDPSGRAIAVGGRIMPGREPGADGYVEPKYKNSPETAIYSKRRTLYALNWAKEDVIRAGEVVVCEGYTDVIALFGAGIERAVATCGTALGEDHFRTMRNFARRIVLAYDADAAGQSAAASVYQWERQYEVDVAVARLPDGADPADLAQRDPAALRVAVADAIPFLGFRLERAIAAANLATAEGRARAGESALEVLAEHPSELVRDQYVMEVADRLRLDSATLRARLAEWIRRGHAPEPPARARAHDDVVMPRPGVEALRLRLHRPDDVAGRLAPPLFVHDLQRDIFEALESGEPAAAVIDELRRHGDDAAAQVLARLVVDEVADDDANVTAVIAQLLRAAVRSELSELERELRDGVVAPDVAMATVRDVKERLDLLEGAHGDVAEADLRAWLITRAGATRA